MTSPDRRSIAWGIGLSVLTAASLILASPVYGVWPLAFVAFAPMVVAQNKVLPARWSGLALMIGIGGYLGWILWEILLPTQRWWLLLLVPVLLLNGQLSRRTWKATGKRHLWAEPVLWTAALFLMGWTPLASWIDPGYDLFGQPWLIQPVSLVGIAGLNLLILLVNYAIAGLWITDSPRTSRAATGSVAILMTVWVVGSSWMLATATDGPSVQVAVVQPGLRHLENPSSAAARTALARTTYDKLAAGTLRAAAAGAQVVVWPEATLRYTDPTAGPLTARLRTLASTTGAYLVIGFTPDPAHFNRAVILAPEGTFTRPYDKQHPVTFDGDHSVGGPVRVTTTTLGRIAPIICYDLDFTNTARRAAREGAQLLTVPSWDWPGIAKQHYAHLVLRAVENDVAAAKADTAWDSAIIDPRGRILASNVSTTGNSAMLITSVPLGTGPSFYARTGDLLGWAAVAVAVAWFVIAGQTMRRRPTTSPKSSPSAIGH